MQKPLNVTFDQMLSALCQIPLLQIRLIPSFRNTALLAESFKHRVLVTWTWQSHVSQLMCAAVLSFH